MRDVLSAEQALHLAHFELALGEARIAAVGFALVADGGEAVRVDGQAKQLVMVLLEYRRQLQSLHVVFGQRVVGRTDAELHGHVQTRRRLAASRHAHEDQVGFVVIMGTRAIVVIEGKVDGLDALHVVGVAANRVGLTHGIRRMGSQFLLEWG